MWISGNDKLIRIPPVQSGTLICIKDNQLSWDSNKMETNGVGHKNTAINDIFRCFSVHISASRDCRNAVSVYYTYLCSVCAISVAIAAASPGPEDTLRRRLTRYISALESSKRADFSTSSRSCSWIRRHFPVRIARACGRRCDANSNPASHTNTRIVHIPTNQAPRPPRAHFPISRSGNGVFTTCACPSAFSSVGPVHRVGSLCAGLRHALLLPDSQLAPVAVIQYPNFLKHTHTQHKSLRSSRCYQSDSCNSCIFSCRTFHANCTEEEQQKSREKNKY